MPKTTTPQTIKQILDDLCIQSYKCGSSRDTVEGGNPNEALSQIDRLIEEAKPEDVNDPFSLNYNYEYTRGFVNATNHYEANLKALLKDE